MNFNDKAAININLLLVQSNARCFFVQGHNDIAYTIGQIGELNKNVVDVKYTNVPGGLFVYNVGMCNRSFIRRIINSTMNNEDLDDDLTKALRYPVKFERLNEKFAYRVMYRKNMFAFQRTKINNPDNDIELFSWVSRNILKDNTFAELLKDINDVMYNNKLNDVYIDVKYIPGV